MSKLKLQTDFIIEVMRYIKNNQCQGEIVINPKIFIELFDVDIIEYQMTEDKKFCGIFFNLPVFINQEQDKFIVRKMNRENDDATT